MTSGSAAQQRIVQFRGRRYSLRLEPAFWDALAAAAKARKQRMGKLVASLAQELSADANLASHLRVFCLGQTAAATSADDAPQPALAAGASNLNLVVRHCPTPCLIVSHDRKILQANEPFRRWCGVAAGALIGRPLDHFFKIKTSRTTGALFRAFGSRNLDWAQIELLFATPGRVVSASARAVPVGRRSAEDFAVLIMVEETMVRL